MATKIFSIYEYLFSVVTEEAGTADWLGDEGADMETRTWLPAFIIVLLLGCFLLQQVQYFPICCVKQSMYSQSNLSLSKIGFDGILHVKIQSVHYFAHITTAELSWHVQNCDLVGSLFVMYEQILYSVLQDFDYELKHVPVVIWHLSDLHILFSLPTLNNGKDRFVQLYFVAIPREPSAAKWRIIFSIMYFL